jgi:hypothetical protein
MVRLKLRSKRNAELYVRCVGWTADFGSAHALELRFHAGPWSSAPTHAPTLRPAFPSGPCQVQCESASQARPGQRARSGPCRAGLPRARVRSPRECARWVEKEALHRLGSA